MQSEYVSKPDAVSCPEALAIKNARAKTSLGFIDYPAIMSVDELSNRKGDWQVLNGRSEAMG